MQFNPYQAQFQPQYQPQFMPSFQQPQQPTIFGKFISDFGTITANDVPMTGSAAVFVKNDGSEIQTRAWNSNGTISTTTYKPISDNKTEQTENVSSVSLESLYDDLTAFREEVFSKLDRLDRTFANRTKAKREVESNE